MGGSSAHFLRLVQNHDRPVGLYHINRTPGAEVIQFCTNFPGVLAAGVERLDIDNHHVDIRTLAEMINLRQIFGVIDKEPDLFPIVFHEVLLHGLEALANSLPDSDAGHHHNKLAPAVPLVQLEHGLDVNVSLACAGFHLHVQGAGSQAAGQLVRQLDVVPGLHFADVLQKLLGGQLHLGVGKAQERIAVHWFLNTADVYIPAVCKAVIEGLARKDIHHALHGLGLVRLDGKFELHFCHHSTFLTVLGLYVAKICSKLVATLSLVMELSRKTA